MSNDKMQQQQQSAYI